MPDNRILIFAGLVVVAIIAKLTSRKFYAITKPLPIVFILVLAFLKSTHPLPLWLAAILFGLIGDLLLLSNRGFVPGLLSFLVGHLFYIVAFSRNTGGIYSTAPLILGVGSIAIGVFAFLTQHLLRSRRKRYILPLLLYVVVSSILVSSSFYYPLISYAVIGAVTFAFSDFLLAFDKFVRPIWYVQATVSLTYYTAQWLLAIHFTAI